MAKPKLVVDASELTIPMFRDGNPAVLREDWLPTDSPFKELQRLHEQHLEHLAIRRELTGKLNDLARSFSAEDRANEEAMRASFQSKEATKLPDVTPLAEREEQIAPLRSTTKWRKSFSTIGRGRPFSRATHEKRARGGRRRSRW